MLDGVVAQGRQGLVVRRAEVDEACVERAQAAVRQRVLGLFERRGDGRGNAGLGAPGRIFSACGRAGGSAG